MNALKRSPRKSTPSQSVPYQEVTLKFLSPMQREKSNKITKDWKLFTYPLFGEMIDNI